MYMYMYMECACLLIYREELSYDYVCSVLIAIIIAGPPVLMDQGEVVRRENEELSLDMRDPDSPPAFPSPSLVEWTRDGGEVVSSSENRVFNYSSIFIGSVEPSDAGQYTLTVTNYQLDGVTLIDSDSASLTLNVLCEYCSVC